MSYKVQICLTGDAESMKFLQDMLSNLQIEGLEFHIDTPRPARRTDDFDMLSYGTIVAQPQQRQIGTSSEG
jgi:hypothetical protein